VHEEGYTRTEDRADGSRSNIQRSDWQERVMRAAAIHRPEGGRFRENDTKGREESSQSKTGRSVYKTKTSMQGVARVQRYNGPTTKWRIGA